MQTQQSEPARSEPGRDAVASTLVTSYGGGVETPLAGYAILIGAYAAVFGGSLALVRRRLPRRFSASDVLLLGIATHKVARILTKDWVTSPLRAPFVRYEGSAGGGEVKEKSRGEGLQRAIGELVTCPWCSAPWVGGALLVALAASPRVTRAIAALFTGVAISDFLNQAYSAVKRRA